ncbi:MAG: PIG-L family deacetylase [Anaerolineae bacterium]
MSHLFISPHLDDAILSAGATMAALVRRGELVFIVTTMAGEPPLSLPTTPMIEMVRQRWAAGRDQIRARRIEDARAAAQLGAKVYQLPLYEAVFRTAKDGEGKRIVLYAGDNSVYEAIHPSDDASASLLELKCPRADVTHVYAPLCLDTHVDHRIATNWALAITRGGTSTPLWLYEEYPAAALRKEAQMRQAQQPYRSNKPPYTLDAITQPSDPQDLEAKCAALCFYQSHVKVLWSDMDAMRSAVRSFMWLAGGGSPAERFWHLHL